MEASIVYSLIMFCIAIVYVRKKTSPIGKALVLIYAISAVFTLYISFNDTTHLVSLEDAKLWPYFFLVICHLIFFEPFLQKKEKFVCEKIQTTVNSNYLLIGYIYILFGVITMICYFPTMIRMVRAANWLDSYGSETVYPYSNIIEYFAMNFCSYFRILALIIGFLIFRGKDLHDKKHTLMSIFLIGIAALTAIGEAIIATSRSMFFDIGLILITMYIFFMSNIEKNRKRFITILCLFALPPVISIFYSISVARFESRGVIDYILYYLGHAPIVFNSQLFQKLNSYMYGKHAFGAMFGLTGLSPTNIGATCGQRFITYVGWFFIDFGYFTIPIGLLISRFIKGIVDKSTYAISDLLVVFTYYQFLIKGIFVIGTTYYYTLFSTIIIYILCRIMERWILTIGGRRL